MKKIFYEKVGRKYVPVSEYDSELAYAMPKGDHLIMVYPGGQSTRYNINPNHAALIAAGRVAMEAMTNAVSEASEMRRADRCEKPLTIEQKQAWDNLVSVFGESARYLNWDSAHSVAEAGINALTKEAEKLMTVPAVKKAFNHFLLVCELTKENNNELSS